MIWLEIIKIIIPIATILGALAKPIKKMLTNMNVNTSVTAILLRERLMERYDDYMAKGCISAKELQAFTFACERYWELGFNHFSKHLLEDLEHLRRE